MKISVNIPTRNNNETIEKLIKNVNPIADEILLIDNSTDNTISVAKKASKKVRTVKYKVKDFSKIRNKGISLTRKEWYILYIDSDEFLSKKLISEILELKKNAETSDAYLIKRKHFFKYKNATACLTTRFIKGEPKLARKGTIKFVNKIHERAVYTKKVSVSKLKGSTLHYPIVKKYNKDSPYIKMDLERLIKEKSLGKNVLKQLKQLAKYILIFDYHPRYFKGNVKLWFRTLNYMVILIKKTFIKQ